MNFRSHWKWEWLLIAWYAPLCLSKNPPRSISTSKLNLGPLLAFALFPYYRSGHWFRHWYIPRCPSNNPSWSGSTLQLIPGLLVPLTLLSYCRSGHWFCQFISCGQHPLFPSQLSAINNIKNSPLCLRIFLFFYFFYLLCERALAAEPLWSKLLGFLRGCPLANAVTTNPN